jgi:hypothetical protein
MARTSTFLARSAPLLLAAYLVSSTAFAQPQLAGAVPSMGALAPVDVVAETRFGLSWFPVEVGRGNVDTDGAFTLRFHQPVPLEAEIAFAVERLFEGQRCDGLAFSDRAARVVLVRELRVVPDGAPCEFCETLGALYLASGPRDRLAATGDLVVRWLYADRDVSIEGACTYGWGSETYALDLHTGWNTVQLETTAVIPSGGYCDCHEVLVTAVPFAPEGVRWFFVGDR